MLLAMGIAGWFVVTQPGDIRKDAFEYDQVARSLVEGRGYEYQGQPTMLREPGYPVFRATLYVLGASEQTILYVQVLLVGLSVLLIGSAFLELDEEAGRAAAWGAALAYGFSVYAASHYSEAFTGFLVTLTGYLAVRCLASKTRWYWYGFFVLSGTILILTRMNMAFIPPVLFFAVAMSHSKVWKQRFKLLVVLGLTWILLLLPWVIRNGRQFDQWTISGRSGIQFYARMVKAREPLSRLGASALSVISSRVASSSLGLHPILIEDQWVATWSRFRELAAMLESSLADADRRLRQEALSAITSSPRMLLAYLAWTPIEGLRLWALPSPLSPGFSVENSFYPAWQAREFTTLRFLILGLAHLLQLAFWGLLIYGLYDGWKVFGWKWMPGWIFFAVTLAHLPFDAIIRYGVPAQPWVWGMVAWILCKQGCRLRL